MQYNKIAGENFGSKATQRSELLSQMDEKNQMAPLKERCWETFMKIDVKIKFINSASMSFKIWYKLFEPGTALISFLSLCIS